MEGDKLRDQQQRVLVGQSLPQMIGWSQGQKLWVLTAPGMMELGLGVIAKITDPQASLSLLQSTFHLLNARVFSLILLRKNTCSINYISEFWSGFLSSFMGLIQTLNWWKRGFQSCFWERICLVMERVFHQLWHCQMPLRMLLVFSISSILYSICIRFLMFSPMRIDRW